MSPTVLHKTPGLIDYAECWDLQRTLFDGLVARKTKSRVGVAESHAIGCVVETDSLEGIDAGYLITCQHPHVYTLGKSGNANNLLVNPDFLAQIKATFYKIDRGGDVTYHGPGQLVVYPILDLERIGMGLRDYIYLAEQSVIDTIAEWGVVGRRSEGATGVWIEGGGKPLRKICAVGVRSSHWVTMHGLGFNVSTDLSYFGYINPCGFVDRGVTSLSAEVGHEVRIDEAESALCRHLEKNMNIKIIK